VGRGIAKQRQQSGTRHSKTKSYYGQQRPTQQ